MFVSSTDGANQRDVIVRLLHLFAKINRSLVLCPDMITFTYSNKLLSFKLYTGGFLKVKHVKIIFVKNKKLHSSTKNTTVQQSEGPVLVNNKIYCLKCNRPPQSQCSVCPF